MSVVITLALFTYVHKVRKERGAAERDSTLTIHQRLSHSLRLAVETALALHNTRTRIPSSDPQHGRSPSFSPRLNHHGTRPL